MLKMIELDLVMEKPLANKLNRDFNYLYMASTRANFLQAYQYVKDWFKSCLGGPKPPLTPGAEEGLNVLIGGTGAAIAGAGGVLFANEDTHGNQIELARIRREGQTDRARMELEAQAARTIMELEAQADQTRMELRSQEHRVQLDRESNERIALLTHDERLHLNVKNRIAEIETSLPKSRGLVKTELANELPRLKTNEAAIWGRIIHKHEEIAPQSPKGLSASQSPKGLSVLLDEESNSKIN
jgi:hypothetical protein